MHVQPGHASGPQHFLRAALFMPAYSMHHVYSERYLTVPSHANAVHDNDGEPVGSLANCIIASLCRSVKGSRSVAITLIRMVSLWVAWTIASFPVSAGVWEEAEVWQSQMPSPMPFWALPALPAVRTGQLCMRQPAPATALWGRRQSPAAPLPKALSSPTALPPRVRQIPA